MKQFGDVDTTRHVLCHNIVISVKSWTQDPAPPITFISKIKIGFLEMNDEAVKSCAAQLKLFGTLECVKRLVSLGLVEVSINRR